VEWCGVEREYEMLWSLLFNTGWFMVVLGARERVVAGDWSRWAAGECPRALKHLLDESWQPGAVGNERDKEAPCVSARCSTQVGTSEHGR
jgi:hypothetical protein